MNEYIIVNKTSIENRIAKLKSDLEDEPNPFINTSYQAELDVLNDVLSQSTPLIPEIEKSIDYGIRKSFSSKKHSEIRQDYISNLKLDI